MSSAFSGRSPAGHLVRAIDLSGIRAHLRSFYSETGRPSIDTERRIQMLVVDYRSGIRCERRLCEEGIRHRLSRVPPAGVGRQRA